MNISLNYQLISDPSQNSYNEYDESQIPVVLLHGLFGSLENLNIIGKPLAANYPTLTIDLRNHGDSMHSSEFSYELMAKDIAALINELGWKKCYLIGHSMGAKVAMYLSGQIPDIIQAIVSIDMAPVAYKERRHDTMFAGLNAVVQASVTTRPEAKNIMQNHIDDPLVIQFLLKSFQQGKWKFNLDALEENYESILAWQTLPVWEKPILFLCGGESDYVLPEYRQAIQQQFPLAKAHIISGASHWVHADKPEAVNRAIQNFLQSIN